MTKDEVLKQWADDVSKAYDILAFGHTERAVEILAKTRNAMREALAQPAPVQEPIGYAVPTFDFDNSVIKKVHYAGTVPLYTIPPQRTWVGLTDEEISDIAINNPPMVHEFARAIEVKLKEKNT
jgi:hypothetical protein